MNKSDLIRAYDQVQPTEADYDALWQRIRTDTAQARPARPVMRRVVLLAACTALIVLFAGVGYAAWQKWSLPQPESYELTENGNLQIERQNEYDTVEQNAPALSDEYFIAQAVELLQSVGLDDVQTDKMRVTRQTDLYWDRQEAEVYFLDDENNTSVCYHAQTGALIRLSGIDWLDEGAHACQTAEEAQALAEQYYRKLPVPQGYVVTEHEEYDEQYWSFSFCREVGPELYSHYEAVRVAINPQSGRLTGCNVFSVPLLDDHEPQDVPLTQAQAEQIVRESDANPEATGHVLESAQVEVVMPNWMFTGQNSADLQASKVSRLGWVLVYDKPQSEFADKVMLYVDYYNGQILGGDMIK